MAGALRHTTISEFIYYSERCSWFSLVVCVNQNNWILNMKNCSPSSTPVSLTSSPCSSPTSTKDDAANNKKNIQYVTAMFASSAISCLPVPDAEVSVLPIHKELDPLFEKHEKHIKPKPKETDFREKLFPILKRFCCSSSGSTTMTTTTPPAPPEPSSSTTMATPSAITTTTTVASDTAVASSSSSSSVTEYACWRRNHEGYDLWLAKERLWQPESMGVWDAWGQKPDIAFLVYQHHEPIGSKKRKVSTGKTPQQQQLEQQEKEKEVIPDAEKLVAVIGVIELKSDGKSVAEAENQLTVYLGNCVAWSCRCRAKWNEDNFKGLTLSPSFSSEVSITLKPAPEKWERSLRRNEHAAKEQLANSVLSYLKYVNTRFKSFVDVRKQQQQQQQQHSNSPAIPWIPNPTSPNIHLLSLSGFRHGFLYGTDNEQSAIQFANKGCEGSCATAMKKIFGGRDEGSQLPQQQHQDSSSSSSSSGNSQRCNPAACSVSSLNSIPPPLAQPMHIPYAAVFGSDNAVTMTTTLSNSTTTTMTSPNIAAGAFPSGVQCQYYIKWVNALVDANIQPSTCRFGKAILQFPNGRQSLWKLGIINLIDDRDYNRFTISKYHGPSLDHFLLTLNLTTTSHVWWSNNQAIREQFKRDICDVVWELFDKFELCHNDIRPANICFSDDPPPGRFQLIDWDYMSQAKACTTGKAAVKDGRYPCAGQSAVLLTAGQLILVVFIIEKGVKFDGQQLTEQLIKDKKASWWEPLPPQISTQPKNGDISSSCCCHSAFHEWVKSKGEVVKDVVNKIDSVSRKIIRVFNIDSFNWDAFITQLLTPVKDPLNVPNQLLQTQSSSLTAPVFPASEVEVKNTSAQLPPTAASSSLSTWLSCLQLEIT